MRGEPLESKLRIGLVGYGEVGKILARALREQGVGWVGAWDILLRDSRGGTMKARAKDDGVETCASLAALLERADIVISAVTAANALDVAREAARSIRPGTFFLDLNSASPTTKTSASKLVDAAGAHYVEAGVMTPVPPYGIRAPMLLGGNCAGACSSKGWKPSSWRATRSPAVTVWSATCSLRSRKPFPRSTGKNRARTSSAAWRSTASAAPGRCAKRRTPCERPGSSPGCQRRAPKLRTGSRHFPEAAGSATWPRNRTGATTPTRSSRRWRTPKPPRATARAGVPDPGGCTPQSLVFGGRQETAGAAPFSTSVLAATRLSGLRQRSSAVHAPFRRRGRSSR